MKKGRGNKTSKREAVGAQSKTPSARTAGPARDPDELLPEYDAQLIREGVRGKYAERYAAGTTVVVLEPDVAAAFPDAAAVNAALRALLDIVRRQLGGKTRVS